MGLFSFSKSNAKNNIPKPDTEFHYSFLALDFETATPKRHTPCSIGLVLFNDFYILEQHYYMFKPPNNEFTKNNSAIHGITPKMTKRLNEFPDIWEKIKHLFFDIQIVYHGGSNFDEDVFYKTMDYYDIPVERLDFINTYSIFNDSLSNLAKTYKIPLDHHNPLSDAKVCGILYYYYLTNKASESYYYGKKEKEKFYHEKIDSDILQPDFDNVINTNNPFFKKKVVISGIFQNWLDRNDLALLLKELGADINMTVSKKTNFLIIGENYGPSKISKMRNNIAMELEAQILNEDELLDLFIENNIEY